MTRSEAVEAALAAAQARGANLPKRAREICLLRLAANLLDGAASETRDQAAFANALDAVQLWR